MARQKLSPVYQDGKIYAIAYETGHKKGKEIELLDKTFTTWSWAHQYLASLDPEELLNPRVVLLTLDKQQ